MSAGGADQEGAITDPAPIAQVEAIVERLIHPVSSAKTSAPRDSFHEACASQDLCVALGASVGDWVAISRPSSSQASASNDSWVLRLVEAGAAAVVCPVSSSRKSAVLASLHLPTNVIEQMKVTPGRSVVAVAFVAAGEKDPDPEIRMTLCDELPHAARVVVARVHTPDMHRRYRDSLRSFFCVPRLLRCGEVFYVPFEGLPNQLRDVEEGGTKPGCHALCESDEELEGEDVIETCRPGIDQPSSEHLKCGPFAGLNFRGMFGFCVQSIEPAKASRPSTYSCFVVDAERTELLVQGTCTERGFPYAASHVFCAIPPPLPLTLQGPFERLLGLLAPAVRSWVRPTAGAAAPSTVLVHGPRGCGKRLLWHFVCERLGLHLLEVNCYHIAAQGGSGIEETLQRLVLSAAESSPVVLCLRRIQALTMGGPSLSPAAMLLLQRRVEAALTSALDSAREGDLGADSRPKHSRCLIVLAGTCEDLDDIGGPVRKIFQVEIKLERPNEQARRAAISHLLSLYSSDSVAAINTSADAIAKLTAGLSYTDLQSVCSEVGMGKTQSVAKGKPLNEEEQIERAVKRLQGGSKVAVTLASKVNWADIGGLQDAKDEVMNCITLPLSHGHMFSDQKVRSGILLFGPPGTGKTLLAKAVATECRVHFLSVKGPELLSMYIGESEKNVRGLFQSARELQPCVVFFDELDSLAPARGRGSDSGGVMDRVVSQLLTELDGLPSTVFLVGATNRPDLLDRSLLRPGRLDRMVYLGIAKDKLPLLKAVARKFDLDEPPQENNSSESPLLQAVAKACPSNFTGADVAALCQDAYALAQKEHIDRLDDLASKARVSVTTLLLFLEALENSKVLSCEHTLAGDHAHDGCATTCGAELVFPQSTAATGHSTLEGVPTGLSLYQLHGQAGSFLLVHRSSDMKDSAVSFDPRPISDGEPSFSPGAPAKDPRPGAGAPGSNGSAPLDPRYSSWLASMVANCSVAHGLTPTGALSVRVGWRHFQESLRQLQPSVPMEDLQRYEQLAREYQNTKK